MIEYFIIILEYSFHTQFSNYLIVIIWFEVTVPG